MWQTASRGSLLRCLLFVALALLWAAAVGLQSGHRLRAAEEGRPAAQATQPVPVPQMPRAISDSTSAQALWETLTPTDQAKVDGRVLDELGGLALPSHLGSEGLGLPRTSSAGSALPRLRTRFLVYLQASVDLRSLDERVFASQTDRRSALVDELRQTARSSQAGVLRLLEQRSRAKEGEGAGVAAFQPFFIVNAVAVEGDLATVADLARQPEVTRIVANYPLFLVGRQPQDGAENDAEEATSSSVDGRTYPWNLRKVQADRVHTELNNRGAGAVVGGFDTGVNYRHPALLRQYRGNQNGLFDHNYNWFVPDGELYANGNLGPSVTTQPADCDGYTHGTHTMGTMIGDAGGKASVIGMAPDARWVAIPGICGNTMPGGVRDDIGGIKAFQWFLCPTDLTGDLATADCSRAPDVVNNSWGSANPVNDTFRPIIQVLRAAGVAPVFAAGNPGAGAGSIGTPANAPEAISVGATDEFDYLTYFSAQGPSIYPGEQKPELSAPGSYVLSSVGSANYDYYSGTSMAAPHVAGMIALLVSADLQDGERDFDVEDMERLMTLSAVDLGEPGADPLYGYGRLDAYAALQLAASAGDLRGQVVDQAYGTPLAYAEISAWHPLLGRHFTGKADASGHYSLTLPAGRVEITLSRWGYESATTANQQVASGALTFANFSLLSRPQALISGVVWDEAGPVLNALIYPTGNPALQTHSDSNGRYQFRLPLGNTELIVNAPNHRMLRQPVTTPPLGAKIDLILGKAPSILLVDTSALGGWFIGWPVYRFLGRALEDQNFLYDLWRIHYTTFSDTQPGPDGSTLTGLPSAETLKKYDLVIWVQSVCVDRYCRPGRLADMGAEPALISYLESGGRLLLSGQDVGETNEGSTLFRSYLQAEYVSGYGGYPGQPLNAVDFLDGLKLKLTNGALYGYPNSHLSFSPDVVAPRRDGTSFSVLRYGEGPGAAALAVAPCTAAYRALYLAAGFENLSPRAGGSQPDLGLFLERSIGWLNSNQPESRFALSAGGPGSAGVAGGQVTHQMELANLGVAPMHYRLDLRGNRWPVQPFLNGAPLASSFELPPCSRQQMKLVVDLPLSAQLGERDVVTATVAATSHPSLPQASVVFQTVQMPLWSEAPPLTRNRYLMGTVSDGTGYYLVGGYASDYYNESGGWVSGGPLALNQRFDACANRWEDRDPLPVARFASAVAAIGNRIFVAGGEGPNGDSVGPTNTLFIYDTGSDSWSRGADLPERRANAAVAAVAGKLYLLGGHSGMDALDTIRVYDPARDQWQDGGKMADGPLVSAAATGLNGKIYLFGGYPDYATFREFDPATQEWKWLAYPEFPRFGATLAVGPGGYLYLLGGESYGGLNLVQRYHIASDSWSLVNLGLEGDRVFSNAAYVEGTLYLAGGYNPVITHESLRIEPSFCESFLTGSHTGVRPDDRLSYTVHLRADAVDNPGARLAAPLGVGTSFGGFLENSIGATFNPASRQVEWSGGLSAGQPETKFSYALQLDGSSWQPGDRITHTIHLADGQARDFVRSSGAQIFAPDFAASAKTVSQSAVAAGLPFTYSIDLRSYSPVGGGVAVTDPLPVGLAYVDGSFRAASGVGGYDPAGHRLLWQGEAGTARPGFVNLGSRYVWGDTLESGSAPPPDFTWQEIRATGEPVASGSDNIICDLSIGFTFPLFGKRYTSLCVDVNGTVTFDDPYPYSTIPSACPLRPNYYEYARIAGLWSSLAVDDSVYLQTFGQAPHRYTILQWTDAHWWDSWDDYLGIVRPPDTDFQIILHEDGRVQILVLRVGQAVAQSSATGLSGRGRSDQLTYQCNGNRALTDESIIEFLPPGGIVSPPNLPLTFQVVAKSDISVNSVLTNTATIQSGQAVYTRSVALQVATVELASSGKEASHSQLLPGESVAYTLTLRNRGLADAQSIVLSDTVPSALAIIPGSLGCTAGGCQANGGLIGWQGSLTPGQTVTLTYSATLGSVLADRTPLTNTMRVSAAGVAPFSRSAVVYARSTNLGASVIDFGGRPNEPGDRFTLSVLLRNTGVQGAQVDFSLPLPGELSPFPATVGCGIGQCRLEAGTLYWAGTLPPRGLVSVQVDVKLAESLISGQRIPLRGQMVDHTWGQTHSLEGELVVALHLMIPLLIGPEIEPLFYLPLILRAANP